MAGKVEIIEGNDRLNRYVAEAIDQELPSGYKRSYCKKSELGYYWEIEEKGWFNEPFVRIHRIKDESNPEDKRGKLVQIRVFAKEIPIWVDALAEKLANEHGFHVQKIPS